MKRALPHDPPPSLLAYEVEPGRVLFVYRLEHVERPEIATLTRAQREVLAHLLRGRDNATIAAARGTSPRTTANQVASIFRKLGVSSRAELAAKLTSE